MDRMIKGLSEKEYKHRYHKLWYAKNREKQIAYSKEWVANNKERARKNWRESKLKNKDVRRAQLLRGYGLSTVEFSTLLAKQSGYCAICKSTETIHKNLAVDHDHVTGKVRGLLCMKCNTAIGKLPTAELLESAKSYLLNGGV